MKILKKINDNFCIEIWGNPFNKLGIITKIWHIISILGIIFWILLILTMMFDNVKDF